MASIDSDGPAGKLVKVAKANSALPGGTCRALLVGSEGTATIVDASGNVCADVPLQQGYNPIAVRQVNTGGTADNIWALY
jgi:hypothetical protein